MKCARTRRLGDMVDGRETERVAAMSLTLAQLKRRGQIMGIFGGRNEYQAAKDKAAKQRQQRQATETARTRNKMIAAERADKAKKKK